MSIYYKRLIEKNIISMWQALNTFSKRSSVSLIHLLYKDVRLHELSSRENMSSDKLGKFQLWEKWMKKM